MADRDRRLEPQSGYGSYGQHEDPYVDYVEAEHDPERTRRVSTALLRREQERYGAREAIRPGQDGFQEPGPSAGDLAYDRGGVHAIGPAGAHAAQTAQGSETAKPDADHERRTTLARQANAALELPLTWLEV